MRRRPQRTFAAIETVLSDGAWHELEDLRDATSFPREWVRELRAEGVVDVAEGPVTMVRLRPKSRDFGGL